MINIGDMLARWSNDLFVSTPHRVVNASGRERFSIPVFYDPDYDTVVECLANCATPDNPPRHPPNPPSASAMAMATSAKPMAESALAAVV